MEAPKLNMKQKVMYMILALGMFVAGAMMPAAALAQLQTNGMANNGQTPVFNTAVQGESAGTVGGTLLNAMNWLGNLICPILAAGAAVHTVFQWRAGGRWVPSAATAAGLLSISGIMRLMESFVAQGQTGVMNGF